MAIIAWAHLRIGSFYSLHNDFKQALNYQLTVVSIAEKIGNGGLLANAWTGIGDTYSLQGNFPEAIRAYKQCLRIHNTKKGGPWNKHVTLVRLADVYVQQKKYSLAREYAFASLNIVLSMPRKVPDTESESRRVLASVYLHTNKPDSARLQAESSLRLAASIDDKKRIRDAYQVLYQVCARQRDFAKAFHYQNAYMAYKDSLSRDESTRRLAMLQYSQELAKKEASITLLKKDQQIKAQETRRQRQLFLSTLVGLGIVAFLALALFRNNRQKQIANTLLQKQKAMTEQAMENLKATQTQLIHSEKMASLGELTAGIAHEIQNPLNFVNNFSEVNQELITEIKEELAKGNVEEVKGIIVGLEENEQKINLHGKRADAIVKGMLHHSRASSGEKQLTDINALAEEYLRLSYHGLRAKDKEFNANLITEFDTNLGKVEVIPQELGRVLLNLYNNAFYAIQLKKAQLNGQYQPTLKVTTSRQNGYVIIKVHDNGMGIPENVKSKIFQPFFTTKPTGQGTGLGLSLSYDIITRAHGGELKVETKAGEFAEFIIQLPQN